MKRTPAEVVIQEFADAGVSIRALAGILGVNQSTVSRWRLPAPAGCDGLIKSRYHRTLLALAKKRGATLSADDLVHGRR
mgnify:FL=1